LFRRTAYFVLAFLWAGAAHAAPHLLGIEHSTKADFEIIEITGGLDTPWGLAFLPGGDALITQRPGGLVRVNLQSGKKTPIPGAPIPLVIGQGGLLDIVLSPDFDQDHRVYFSYAAGKRSSNHTEIARGRFENNTITDLQVIFRANTTKKRGGQHFGSRLVFGRNGMLYASIGDGFSYMDEAQNLASHFGSIIRIHPDGQVPADNPFVGRKGAAPEIYSYGHRNPQGMALNPDTGELWQHEHGPMGGDEINIIRAGENYGWPKATFGIDYSGAIISDYTKRPGMTAPLLHWTPSIAPSGMAFYTGDQFPLWQGDIFVGALAGQHLRRVKFKGTKPIAQEKLLESLEARIRDVRNGPNGALYVLTNGSEGQLIKLQAIK
jgi:aldose sugar dehydrogenase